MLQFYECIYILVTDMLNMPRLVPGYRDEVREKILDVAWKVLLEKGVQESTMDDIANELSCSKGAIYNYFKNKDELLESAIAAGRLRFRDEIFSRYSKGDFFANSEKFFDTEILKSAENSMQTTLSMILEGSKNPRVREAMKLKYEGVIGAITELFDELTSAGKISIIGDRESAARSFFALRIGVLMSLAYGTPKDEAKKVWMNGIHSIIK